MDAANPTRRRILLSAYACSPLWGSETEIGWGWFVQLARRYEVVLLTHAHFRSHIEPALAKLGLGAVEVRYFQAPAFGLHPHTQLNSRLYYIWWQCRVRAYVRQLLAERQFDLVHHITWSTLRFPCLIGGMGAPLVMGPLGGGESAPLRFFEGLPLRARAFDALRSLSLLWVRIDPLATWGPRRAAIVFCKSPDSLRALPRAVRAHARVSADLGSVPAPAGLRRADDLDDNTPRRRRLLFAGRLLGWKGVALALGAVDLLVRAGHDVALDIAGGGPLRPHLEEQIQRRGLQDRVRLLGLIPREDLLSLYGRADLFVFPSLHDSSGTVVLEALARGLPVVCLDLGGPQLMVDRDCGLVVSTQGRSRAQLEQAIADAIASLLASPERLRAFSRHAVEHARRQDWESVVGSAYALVEERMRWSVAPASAEPSPAFD